MMPKFDDLKVGMRFCDQSVNQPANIYKIVAIHPDTYQVSIKWEDMEDEDYNGGIYIYDFLIQDGDSLIVEVEGLEL